MCWLRVEVRVNQCHSLRGHMESQLMMLRFLCTCFFRDLTLHQTGSPQSGQASSCDCKCNYPTYQHSVIPPSTCGPSGPAACVTTQRFIQQLSSPDLWPWAGNPLGQLLWSWTTHTEADGGATLTCCYHGDGLTWKHQHGEHGLAGSYPVCASRGSQPFGHVSTCGRVFLRLPELTWAELELGMNAGGRWTFAPIRLFVPDKLTFFTEGKTSFTS